jgi:hypothetical protein
MDGEIDVFIDAYLRKIGKDRFRKITMKFTL